MMMKVFTATLLLFCITYSEGRGTCICQKFEKVPPPQISNRDYNPSNGSLSFKTCGTGPDIVFSVKPERLTAKADLIHLDIITQALADSEGGFMEADITLQESLSPFVFASSYDCYLFEEGNLNCPLPVKKGIWYQVKAECDTRFYIPNMYGSFKARITNYADETVFCMKGNFRSF